jgi:hypothetical protein
MAKEDCKPTQLQNQYAQITAVDSLVPGTQKTIKTTEDGIIPAVFIEGRIMHGGLDGHK